MDIGDAHKLKIITTAETKELLMAYFDDARKARFESTFERVSDVNEQIAYLRSSVIGMLIEECKKVFVENEATILCGDFDGQLIRHISERPREAFENSSRPPLARR